MADGGNITQRITDLIGSEHSTNAAYSGDLINAAMNEIADMLPDELLIKYANTPSTLDNSPTTLDAESQKILLVLREDADSGAVLRECKKVSYAGFEQAKDSDSMFEATVLTPVYTLIGDTLHIYPTPVANQEAKVYKFTYVTDGVDTTSMTQATLRSTYYLPDTAIHAIALKSSINMLQAYVSNFVQDDEDIEMQQMINTQIQGLKAEFQTEMQRFLGEKAE